MSELDGTRTISIPSLVLSYVDNRLESIGTGGETYVRERVIRGVPAELDVIEDNNRWFELFGTPERAARTLEQGKTLCGWCDNQTCATSGGECRLFDYDALLEWLSGGAR